MDVSNVNGTHNLPPRPPSNTIAQTRQKIVEILAGTANGCLAELGYFPGMPQRLKELEHQNEQWKLENMKLYQDNASLLELIHQQNERIKQMHFPDSEKNVRIMELDAELQKTRSERDELARVQAAMNSTPSQLQQNFTHLQSDYIKVVNVYRILRAEVGRLQDQIRALAAPKYPSQPQGPQPPTQHQQQPQQPQQQSRPQVQQHLQSQHLHQPQPKHFQHRQSNCPPQRQSAPSLLQPHAQQQHYQPLLDLSRLQSVQQINPQLPPIFGQGQRQQHPLSQTQQAVLEQKPRFRQSSISGSMPAPASTRSGQDSFVNTTSPQHHALFYGGQPISSRPNSKPQHSNRLRAAQSMSPVVATTYDPLATQSRSSSSNNSGPPTPVVPSHSPLSQHFFTPPSSNFNLDPPKIAMISSNKVPSTSIELLDPKTSSSVPPSISLQDIYSSPVNQVRSPGIQSFNTNATNTGTSISAPVVSQPVNVALGLPVSIPLHQVQSLKRGTPTQSEGHHDEQLQKRPRLEGSQLELTTNIPIEFVADGTEDTIQMDVEEDDEVIEVGPDGLRLVEDCIFDLFGEEGGEGRNCKLCIARRDMGYHVEPLKPFVNATNDELLEHCVTEHAEAWDTLRHSV